jgi:predicted secreted protein
MKCYLTYACLAIGLVLGGSQLAHAQPSAGGSAIAAPSGNSVTVIMAGETMDGTTVTVARGSVVKIHFAEPQGTGYSWSEKSGSGTGTVISKIQDVHVSGNGSWMFGIGGGTSKAKFIFAAIGPGQCRIEFIYSLPWRKVTPPRNKRSKDNVQDVIYTRAAPPAKKVTITVFVH